MVGDVVARYGQSDQLKGNLDAEFRVVLAAQSPRLCPGSCVCDRLCGRKFESAVAIILESLHVPYFNNKENVVDYL